MKTRITSVAILGVVALFVWLAKNADSSKFPAPVRTFARQLNESLAGEPAVAAQRSAGSVATAKTQAAAPRYTDGKMVEGSGKVVKVLSDDTEGTRHQKFILRDASGRTVLVAHNISLAPRIQDLKAGDTVDFYGEFRDNAQGGVIHWTHLDPQRRHVSGWLRHNGRVYQ